MLKRLWLLPLAAGMMMVSPLSVGEESVQKQEQKPVVKQEQVYGSQMMTKEERIAYRTKMRSAKTQEERQKIRADHHDEMVVRAKERGVTLPDVPPAMGGGMGPGGGGGMGPGGGMGAGPKGL